MSVAIPTSPPDVIIIAEVSLPSVEEPQFALLTLNFNPAANAGSATDPVDELEATISASIAAYAREFGSPLSLE